MEQGPQIDVQNSQETKSSMLGSPNPPTTSYHYMKSTADSPYILTPIKQLKGSHVRGRMGGKRK